ncbi:MAG: hypothetical protein BGO12_10795 [Verrucomicrobia bacterium 61-8]|nr:MAG: hypothetical protein BGO12_10795 [Verrucomicrobia bacterium 61-8]
METSNAKIGAWRTADDTKKLRQTFTKGLCKHGFSVKVYDALRVADRRLRSILVSSSPPCSKSRCINFREFRVILVRPAHVEACRLKAEIKKATSCKKAEYRNFH